MKKLFLILLLLPLFCSSQVLFDKPMSECYVNKETNEFSSFITLKGSKIYVDDDFLVIDIITDIKKYKIIDKKEIEDLVVFKLLKDDKKYVFVCDISSSSENQWMFLYLESNKKERISYTNAF